MKTIACLLAVTLACSPAMAVAQEAAQATAQTTTTAATQVAATVPAPAAAPDVMPLSLSRVQRRLLAAEVAKPSTAPGLRIEEFVNVYGKSIAFDIMRDYDVKATAVQYGGMTHTEFLDLVTPKMYRQPTVDFIGLAVGAAKWAVTRAAEKRRKAEQERIEEEARRMRELGVAPPK